jgi:hypothetical protein
LSPFVFLLEVLPSEKETNLPFEREEKISPLQRVKMTIENPPSIKRLIITTVLLLISFSERGC